MSQRDSANALCDDNIASASWCGSGKWGGKTGANLLLVDADVEFSRRGQLRAAKKVAQTIDAWACICSRAIVMMMG